MHRLTLKTQISILFGLFTTLIILITGSFFSLVYYYVSEKDIHLFLSSKSKQIVNDHLVYKNDQIYYKINDQGETLSAHLRSYDLSAVVMDNNKQVITSFGIYRNLLSQNPVDQVIDMNLVNSSLTEKLTYFSHSPFKNLQYDLYTIPLFYDDKPYGSIQFAKESSFINKIIDLNIVVLFIILPISILISWLSGYLIVAYSFKPLNKLITYMQDVKAHQAPEKIFLKNTHEETKRIADAFNQMLDRIGEDIRKQKEFIANVSHELKTPLTQAVTSLDLTLLHLKSQDYQEVKKETKLVKEDLLNLNKTIESLLSMSQITELPQKPKREIVNFNEIAQVVLEKYQLDKEQKRLKVKLSGNKRINLSFSKEHLNVLLSNLLSNAIKYSRLKSKIEIKWYEKNLTAVLEVKDWGIGISPNEQKHLFDRFYRGKIPEKLTDGSGLGLAIVESICKLWELDIYVNSQPNKGTKFTLSGFPLA